MMLDARDEGTRLDRGATVVVVGAGPAGIVLARELAGRIDLLLIEAGGDAEESWLLEGGSDGIDYRLATARARRLGGSSALWAGYCAALSPEDFAPRPWLPLAGWPLDEGDLAPFYGRASKVVGVAPERGWDRHDPRLDPERLRVSRWTFAPATRRFAEGVRDLAVTPGVDVLTRASVVDIQLARGHDRVEALLVRTADGREGRIHFQQLVLACGGIETPRLLLAANGQVPAGIGNKGGMVGRCFMEHPHRVLRGVRLRPDALFERSVHRLPRGGGCGEMLNFGLPADLRRRLGLLDARAHAFQPVVMKEDGTSLLGLMMEQAPNPGSRVTLGGRGDAVGLRHAQLRWQLTDLDRRSFLSTAAVVAAELERAGLAEVLAAEDADAPVGYCCHQLGTTRMSADPSQGVTDPHCRVHGIDNLHVAGGSVFPTSGWANPTFTVLALTLRLADRLKGVLGAAAGPVDTNHTKELAP